MEAVAGKITHSFESEVTNRQISCTFDQVIKDFQDCYDHPLLTQEIDPSHELVRRSRSKKPINLVEGNSSKEDNILLNNLTLYTLREAYSAHQSIKRFLQNELTQENELLLASYSLKLAYQLLRLEDRGFFLLGEQVKDIIQTCMNHELINKEYKIDKDSKLMCTFISVKSGEDDIYLQHVVEYINNHFENGAIK